jgi:hypothetical protein
MTSFARRRWRWACSNLSASHYASRDRLRELAGTDYRDTYLFTLLAAILRLVLTSCLVAGRGKLAGAKCANLYTLLTWVAVRQLQLALTKCRAAARMELAGT